MHKLLVLLLLGVIIALVPTAAAQDEPLRLEEGRTALTVVGPPGWVSEEAPFSPTFPAFVFAPDESMLRIDLLTGNEPPTLEPGQVMLVVSILDNRSVPGSDRSVSVSDAAQIMADTFQSLGEASLEDGLIISGQAAALVKVNGGSFSFGYLLIDAGIPEWEGRRQFAIIALLTAPGELEAARETALTVAQTIRIYDDGVARFGAGEGEAAPVSALEARPLLEMLSLLPAMPDAGSGRPNTTVHYLDLEALGSLDFAALRPYIFTIAELYQAEQAGMEDTIGISLAQIRRVVMYGLLPARMYVLAGEFDGVAITEALAQLGFEIRATGSIVSFCHPEGCDQAMRTDLMAVERGNPFGGSIGRLEAIALIKRQGQDDLLFASTSAALIDAALAPFAGGEAGAGSPDMLAAAEALLAAVPDTPLVAACFIAPEEIEGANAADAVALPPYSFAAVGSYRGDPSTALALLYADSAAAEAAVAALPLRLDALIWRGQQTYREQFEGDAIAIGAAQTVTLTDGRAAAVQFFDAPAETDSAYQMILHMIYGGDAAWLNAAGG